MGANIATQSLELGVFLCVGLVSGVLLWSLFFIQYCLATKILFNLLTEILLVLSIGGAFILIEFLLFDYQIEIYHFALFGAGIIISSLVLKWSVSDKKDKIKQKMLTIKKKFFANKFISKLTK